MPRKYKSANEHLDAIECAIQVAPKHLTTKEVAVLCHISPNRATELLQILCEKRRVHSIHGGLSYNGRVWKAGAAPDNEPARRDPLVSALFGAPQVAA